MNNLEITWQTILAICAGVVVIINTIKIINGIFKPIKKIEKKLLEHEELLQRDYKRLTDAEASNKVICKCMLALLDNEITGNSIEKLKLAKKDLQDFLINK